jgi:hypothetical protein
VGDERERERERDGLLRLPVTAVCIVTNKMLKQVSLQRSSIELFIQLLYNAVIRSRGF